MKQGFFFDGINMTGYCFAIDQSKQHAGLVFSNAAFTPTAIFYDAPMAA
jgi:hypothetical protein